MIYDKNDIHNALKAALFSSDTLNQSMVHHTYQRGYRDALKTIALAFGIEDIEGAIPSQYEVADDFGRTRALLAGEPSA